jgi:hypothetical protein
MRSAERARAAQRGSAAFTRDEAVAREAGGGLDLGVRERVGRDAGREVGHAREPEHPRAHVPRGDHLGDGAHAHEVGAERAQHANLRGGLVARAQQPGVDALAEDLPDRLGRGVGQLAEGGIVRVGHVGKARAERGLVGTGEG